MNNEEINTNLVSGAFFVSALIGTTIGLWTDFKVGFTSFVILFFGLLITVSIDRKK